MYWHMDLGNRRGHNL